jgi:hypothetical protein
MKHGMHIVIRVGLQPHASRFTTNGKNNIATVRPSSEASLPKFEVMT